MTYCESDPPPPLPPNISARNWAEVHHMLNIYKDQSFILFTAVTTNHCTNNCFVLSKVLLIIDLHDKRNSTINMCLLLLDKLYSLRLWSRDWYCRPKNYGKQCPAWVFQFASDRICSIQPYPYRLPSPSCFSEIYTKTLNFSKHRTSNSRAFIIIWSQQSSFKRKPSGLKLWTPRELGSEYGPQYHRPSR